LEPATPPFVPALTDEIDTSNFDEIEDDSVDPLKDTTPKRPAAGYNGDGLPFVGYSFSREQYLANVGNSSEIQVLLPPLSLFPPLFFFFFSFFFLIKIFYLLSCRSLQQVWRP